ncbi:MAG: MmcB family DNA repair protein [Pseudomonadota bacterium]
MTDIDPLLPTATDIASGVLRQLFLMDVPGLTEVTLANHRRADVMGLTSKGEIWIIEIKSSVADFRSDQKWPEYTPFCDRFFFAVSSAFPDELIPESCGLIIADRFGAAIVRDAPNVPLAAARRKALTLRFARLAAQRTLVAHGAPLDASSLSPRSVLP